MKIDGFPDEEKIKKKLGKAQKGKNILWKQRKNK